MRYNFAKYDISDETYRDLPCPRCVITDSRTGEQINYVEWIDTDTGEYLYQIVFEIARRNTEKLKKDPSYKKQKVTDEKGRPLREIRRIPPEAIKIVWASERVQKLFEDRSVPSEVLG